MGYYTSLYGELEIEPEVADEQAKEINKLLEENHGGDHLYSDCPWYLHREREEYAHTLQSANFEKPYDYVEWLEIIIKEVFIPRGYVLNGEIYWDGSESGDQGSIYVKDNVVEAVDDIIYNPGPRSPRRNHSDQAFAFR